MICTSTQKVFYSPILPLKEEQILVPLLDGFCDGKYATDATPDHDGVVHRAY